MKPTPYDHYRSTDADVTPGIYRVVGTGEPVALLRVADADDRRRSTGELVTVDRDALETFEPAENPDGNRPATERFASVLDALGWSLRTFTASLAARPVPTAVAVALLALGWAADWIQALPESAGSVLVVVGAVALAYLGSRGTE